MKKILISFIAFITVFFTAIVAKGQANNLNPFDYIGSSHNSIANTFFSEYTPGRVQSENLSISGLTNYIVSNSGINEVGLLNEILSQSVCQDTRNTKLVDLPNQLIQMNAISQHCGTYILSINDAIENTLVLGNESFYDRIKSLENDVLSDDQLSNGEDSLLLCMASIARYSADYWVENYNVISSSYASIPSASYGGILSASYDGILSTSYGNILSERYGRTGILPKWLRDLIAADVGGAAGGWVAGALIGGTATLGTLTVPAAVAGAVTWGAAGSVASGVTSLWNWIFN